MTEEEAKTKWCPFVRFTPPSERSSWETNRPSGINGSSCIGSACMAWRLAYEPDGTPKYRVTKLREPGHTDNEPEGYCGLAGKPE